jgi:hypothetical protein
MDDERLDVLLSEMLALPEGSEDPGFVSRVDRAVTEAEWYRGWKRALRFQVMTEALAVGAIAASIAVIAGAPGIREEIAGVPGLLWPAVLCLFLLWTLIRGGPRALTATR